MKKRKVFHALNFLGFILVVSTCEAAEASAGCARCVGLHVPGRDLHPMLSNCSGGFFSDASLSARCALWLFRGAGYSVLHTKKNS